MRVNRRRILGTVASAAVLSSGLSRAAAQSTPVAAAGVVPGYAIARVRALPTPELAGAVVADVLATFLPPTAALPGYALAMSSARASPTPRQPSP